MSLEWQDGMVLDAPRLRLRPLNDADAGPWVALFTDPEVTRYAGGPTSREDAARDFDQHRHLIAAKGYGWWAIDLKDGPSFAGVIVLRDFPVPAAFAPAIEIGWLLPHAYWGNGYAGEGARAALDYAFAVMKVDRVVAATHALNVRSQRVMERLGMTHDPADDFDDRQSLEGPLDRIVVYRLERSRFRTVDC